MRPSAFLCVIFLLVWIRAHTGIQKHRRGTQRTAEGPGEIRHYKLFYGHLQRYLKSENLGSLNRLKVLLGRIAESEDDELAYAYYAAHRKSHLEPYNRALYSRRYLSAIGQFYRKQHVDRMVAMVFKAVGIRRLSLLNKLTSYAAWHFLQFRLHLATTPHKTLRA